MLIFAWGTPSYGNGDLININTANVKELLTLPFIGEKRAKAIVQSRERDGRFRRPEELIDRHVIGEKTFEAIQYRITTGGSSKTETSRPISITNVHINGLAGDIYFLDNRNFSRVLNAKIVEAKRQIFIAMYLFKISENKQNFASQLFERLNSARKRGVNVEVILEYSDYNHTLNQSNQYTLKRLKDAGIKVRFDSATTQTHTKLIVIDDQYTFIGSHNFSHSALGLNNELSLMVDSDEIAEKSIAYFKSIE